MFVLIVGGGRTGSRLAKLLIVDGHRVMIIEDRNDIFELLKQEFSADQIMLGDGSLPDVLEKAGVSRANVVAAVTIDDDVNLVISSLARFEFGVKRVIARVNDPHNAWLFTPEMGVDVGLNQADILAKLIAEEMSLGDMMMLLKLRRGEYTLVEEKLKADAPAVGKQLRQLPLPDDCAIAALFRQGKVIVPRNDLVVEADDEVLAVVSDASLPGLRKVFNG